MSKTRRPPDILRKSHPHLDNDERARRKRELLDALDEAIEDDDGDAGDEPNSVSANDDAAGASADDAVEDRAGPG